MELRDRRFLDVWHAEAFPFAQNNIAVGEAQIEGEPPTNHNEMTPILRL
jgi:hypothetical protein